jgi:spermidine synthase
VFVSGAVLMALEMTGSRVLAIHFGSSIYVWGAIIGIFLAALSLGYYSGGMLADKKPTFFLLNLLLLIAGFWLMLIPFYANATCRAVLRLNPGERLGPLLSTTILFGGPSVLLGMVSPYSVRLAARELERMGNVSGRLYALSTFGSIAGTLLTAFWLIPAAGVRLLLQVLGLCLVVLPLVVLPGSNKRRALSLGSLALAPLLIFLNLKTVTPLPPQQALVYEGDSPYHYIKVVDDKQGNTRFLQFNNYVEGAIDLSPPYETRVSYTNAFQLARIFKRDLQHILIIGGGGGIGARKFVADDERVVVDLVEIDPQVVDLSSKYFYLEPGPRLRIHVEDGRNFVRRTTTKYDLVILDAFTIGGQIPFHLTTQEFMREIKSVLTPGGVLLANINGTLEGRRSRIWRSEYKTVTTVFKDIYLFPHLLQHERKEEEEIDRNRSRNVILIAVEGPSRWSRESIAAIAAELENSGIVRTPTFLQDARQLYELSVLTNDVPLLTDNYAPVDTMVF